MYVYMHVYIKNMFGEVLRNVGVFNGIRRRRTSCRYSSLLAYIAYNSDVMCVCVCEFSSLLYLHQQSAACWWCMGGALTINPILNATTHTH